MSIHNASPAMRFQTYLVANARAARPSVEIGPFVAQFDEGDANPFRNYATPLVEQAATADDVKALMRLFEGRGRRPRLEYVEAACPRLADLLAGHGFAREPSPALMTRAAAEAPSRPHADHAFELATEDTALADAAHVQNQAYGAGPASAVDVERLARVVRNGGLVGLMRDRETGVAACSGLCTPPRLGVLELAAVGTLAPMRNRGLAAALTDGLAQAARERALGDTHLMAFSEEQAIYERLGFFAIGTIVQISVSRT